MLGLVVDRSGSMMDSHGRCMMRSLDAVHGSVVYGSCLVMGDSSMSSLVVDWGSMHGGLVMRCSLVHLLSHKLLEERLGHLDVLDTGRGLVGRGSDNLLVMRSSCSMLRDSHILDLTICILRNFNVAHTGLLDVARLSVMRLTVDWFLHVDGLTVVGLGLVR